LFLALVAGWPAAPASPQEKPCPEGYLAIPIESRTAGAKQEYRCVETGGGDESGGAVAAPTDDEFLDEARQVAFEYSSTLPNFIVDELVTRYVTTKRPPKWKRKDRLSAEVLWVDGKERYQELKRNGKRLKQQRLSAFGGSWSFGEYGTMMQNIFHPRTAAAFEPPGEEELRGVRTQRYNFTVEQANSGWRVEHEGQRYFPAYEGSLWIDPETLRVLRIEVQARDVANNFPLSVVEMTADYGPVKIGGEEYVMITDSEFLSCKRYSQWCSRNTTEFRNYRRFTAASTVMQTDSSITFEGEAPAKPQPKQ